MGWRGKLNHAAVVRGTAQLHKKFYGWEGASDTPNCGKEAGL